MDEREATIAWRNLLQGKEVTPDVMAKAEAILDELRGESPLYLRLSKELDELRELHKRRSKA